MKDFPLYSLGLFPDLETGSLALSDVSPISRMVVFLTVAEYLTRM